ncbi:hypothetical protein F0L68_02365 [Solihabitans fulvus]|uniref:Uncharacterized protein n=1 Tax=Solihabitans fulvus TaxID=1892852 RepID=A0A5B2XV23_9PSEU|nr:NB-ARC domain-containing protein [Solihabitans fulvus]KAA2266601.1 hypothetical protein F0L68_02365 [Solihabitans fulvus]
MGKTTLAVHWARQTENRFPDGQLYVNLSGFSTADLPMPTAKAIRGFLDAFAVPPERIPASLDEQAKLYRSLLAGRRMLVVLDNARHSDQARALLPGSTTAMTIVTSRHELTGLVATEDTHLLTLGLLSATEAHELLALRLGRDRVAAEPEAADELIALCARLPLALAIAAARAAARPAFLLATLAEELRDNRARLDPLESKDLATNLRAVFSWSYRSVGADAARMFRLLGVHPGPDISLAAAASLAGTGPVDARVALRELTEAHLLDEHRPGRFAFHELLRAYATEQAATVDSDADRDAAMHRMLDHYLHTGRTAALLVHPPLEPIALDPGQPG